MDFAILNAQRDFAWGRGSAATQTNKQLKFLCKKSPFSPFKTLVVALYAFFKRSRSFIKPSIKRLIIVIRKRPSDLGEFTVYKAHKHYRMIFFGQFRTFIIGSKITIAEKLCFCQSASPQFYSNMYYYTPPPPLKFLIETIITKKVTE